MNDSNTYPSRAWALAFLINCVTEKSLVDIVKKIYNFRKLLDSYKKENDNEEKQYLGEIIRSISKFATITEVRDIIANILSKFEQEGLGQLDVSIFLRLLHTI